MSGRFCNSARGEGSNGMRVAWGIRDPRGEGADHDQGAWLAGVIDPRASPAKSADLTRTGMRQVVQAALDTAMTKAAGAENGPKAGLGTVIASVHVP